MWNASSLHCYYSITPLEFLTWRFSRGVTGVGRLVRKRQTRWLASPGGIPHHQSNRDTKLPDLGHWWSCWGGTPPGTTRFGPKPPWTKFEGDSVKNAVKHESKQKKTNFFRGQPPLALFCIHQARRGMVFGVTTDANPAGPET